MDEENKIHYRLYRKETDARLFLNPTSYHPHNVFSSVIFSQMIRVIERNSKTTTCGEDLEELKKDLKNSGHSQQMIEKLEPKAFTRVFENKIEDTIDKPNKSSLVFSLKYFKDVDKLKDLVFKMKEDISALCGDQKIVFAIRKHESIGNTIVKNRKLSSCSQEDDDKSSQKCEGRGCKTCPMVFDENEIRVNGQLCKLDTNLDCKSKNILYLAQCQLCDEFDNTYFGQTMTAGHVRMNGHMVKFCINESKSYEQSALSLHSFEKHHDQFSLSNFKVGFVKCVKPQNLDREEDILILKFKTHIWGLNRIKVKR